MAKKPPKRKYDYYWGDYMTGEERYEMAIQMGRPNPTRFLIQDPSDPSLYRMETKRKRNQKTEPTTKSGKKRVG